MKFKKIQQKKDFIRKKILRMMAIQTNKTKQKSSSPEYPKEQNQLSKSKNSMKKKTNTIH